MDHSKRLDAEVTRRARLTVTGRARRYGNPAKPPADIGAAVLELAANAGVDIANLTPATDAEMAAADERARQEWREERTRVLLLRLPVQYRAAHFPRTDFGALAQRWVRRYVDGLRTGLVILGDPGSGKTWVACAIARALLVEHTVPTTVVTVSELLASLRPSDGAADGVDADMMTYAVAPVLVLDDLGTEKLTDWSAEQLYRLAHERSHNGRPTIVTSNLSGEAIKARYDRRTVERLFGGSELITIQGPSLRPMPF